MSAAVIYKTKLIRFLGRNTPIILQNYNGPCPLLAICNILLLRNYIHLSPDVAEVSQEKLLSLVRERLIESNSNNKNKNTEYVANLQRNINDALDLLPKLATGIDVNIKFRRIDDYEFTRECTIFDLLDISLYHGWIVDPQDYETARAIGSKSYNEITKELVAPETRNMEVQHRRKLIGSFLGKNASQLTSYGLSRLRGGVKDNKLCVFFRNNHFSTMFKYGGELYLLATDQVYLNLPNLVWETLNKVNGDAQFMTGDFKEFKLDNHHATGFRDEQNAMDYNIARTAAQSRLDVITDLDTQLAMALQQLEYEEQP
ncbi:hypothetical protein DITRI_Ditri16bG0151300 [Diplodiscus trichospermus]